MYGPSGSELSAVEIADPGVVGMNSDQYDAAVRALAVLIEAWHGARSVPVDDVDGPRAA
jgi:hypothetical protein